MGFLSLNLQRIKMLMGISIKLGENVLNEMDQVKYNLSHWLGT